MDSLFDAPGDPSYARLQFQTSACHSGSGFKVNSGRRVEDSSR